MRLIPSLFATGAMLVSTNVTAETALSELPSGTYTLDKTHASLIWKVSHLGLSDYVARFTDFDATIQLDTQDPTKSSVTATINPASVETDYPNPEKEDFDAKLRSEEWLNTSAFPKITFTSTKLVKEDDDEGELTGELTFLGVTKTITLEVELEGATTKHPFAQKAALGFSASGTIKRSEFGFDTYIPTIGDEVEIEINAEFMQAE